MKPETSTILALLFAGAAIASPTPSLRRRAQRPQRLPQSFKPDSHSTSAASPPPQYYYNLGGLIAEGTGITGVQGTFTIPNVTLAPNDNPADSWTAMAYVGIDGTQHCSQAVSWEAGVEWIYSPSFPTQPPGGGPVTQSGTWYYFPYVQFYPAQPIGVELDMKPGDSITAIVQAPSKTFGTYSLTNHATGQTIRGNYTSKVPLCETSADWFIFNPNGATGDGTSGYGQNPNFHSLYFNQASYMSSGNTYNVSNAAQVFMIYNNTISTGCSVGGPNTINCGWSK